MQRDVAGWFDKRTSTAAEWPLDRLLEAKRESGQTVALVLPARNEEATVGEVVRGACELRDAGLLNELVVVDSRSTDLTAEIARAAGATVVRQDAVLPSLPRLEGKGDTLYMGVAATYSDLVVFGDTDVTDWRSEFVTGLLGPLLTTQGVKLVKGFYDRPLEGPDGVRDEEGGGRTTEICVRPLFAHRWPQLAGVIQPLGGEYAAPRSWLERLRFPVGYGVETAILLDTLTTWGLTAIAQVDLGRRTHSHQSTKALGRMAAEIQHAERLRRSSLGLLEPSPTLIQFSRGEDGSVAPVEVKLNVDERPPLRDVLGYRATHAPAPE